jgi:exodeoxyribonuclease VII large subunit
VDTFAPEDLVAERTFNDLPGTAGVVWGVGPLMRAIADALAARFNPVAVRGEISGYARAASGHCYFSLKDEGGQVRCAMFRRSADQLSFVPRDGQVVEARGKLDVYGPRGDLQLIVDSLKPSGEGALFERFMRLKAQLASEGLFDDDRKRELPSQPNSIGVVTSLGAAALRDVVIALQRRVPHIPVVIYAAAVQGALAPTELCAALRTAYRRHAETGESDVLLLVRGGGSLEDLWSFNDEALVRLIKEAPMPVVSGVGHETDFTLADFAADLRAPTPTAAAEMCAPTRDSRLGELQYLEGRLGEAVRGVIDQRAQHLDRLGQRLGRPSGRVHESQRRLQSFEHRLQKGLALVVQAQRNRIGTIERALPLVLGQALKRQQHRLEMSSAALALLDPQLVLERGYALLTDERGTLVKKVADAMPGDALSARLSDGILGVSVRRVDQYP